MNRRNFIAGSVATISATQVKPTLAEENLDLFNDQMFLPDGSVAKAFRRFETNPDDSDENVSLTFHVEVFQDKKSAKAWWNLQRDNIVAFWESLDSTDLDVEAQKIEVDEKIGSAAYMIRRAADKIINKRGALSLYSIKGNVLILSEVNDVSTFNDLVDFVAKAQNFKIEDPSNKEQMLALLATEEDAKEFDSKMKQTHESVSFVVDGEWERDE